MTHMRTCGNCGDMWPIHAVRCGNPECNRLLVMTAGDRVNAKFYGGRRVWEARPSGRATEKDAA